MSIEFRFKRWTFHFFWQTHTHSWETFVLKVLIEASCYETPPRVSCHSALFTCRAVPWCSGHSTTTLANGRPVSGSGSVLCESLLDLRLPCLQVPPANPTAWPGCPSRPLRRPPVRLGLNGNDLNAQAGGGAAVCQRLLCERRPAGHQLGGALYVLDPHGDLSARPAGEKPQFRSWHAAVFGLDFTIKN